MVNHRLRVPSFIGVMPDGPAVPLQSGLLSPDVLARVQAGLGEHGHVLVLYADVVRFGQAEQLLGATGAERLLSLLPDALVQAIRLMLPDVTVLQVQHVWSDDFLVYLTLPEPPRPERWDGLAAQIGRMAALALNPQHNGPGVRIELQVALAMLRPLESSLRSQIARTVKALQERARPDQELPETADLLSGILETGRGLRMVYQPIVALQTGAIAGYEALARGPEGTPLASPLALFAAARAHDQLFALELACRRLAVQGAAGMSPQHLLFLNLEPQAIHAHDFVSGKTSAMLAQVGLTPANVVIEVTERSSVGDFRTFREALAHYREQGFRIAVDDAGAGYSSLQAISELQPDFIKIDRSLVTGVAASPVRSSLLRTMVTFARDVGCQVVAEGIETAADLAALRRLGVDLAQGYFLARPAYPRPELTPAAVAELAVRLAVPGSVSSSLPLRSLMAPALTVSPADPLLALESLAAQHPDLAGAVTVVDGRPVGYLSWSRLWQHLSSPFARALAAQVQVADRHEHHPLVFAPETPLAEAAHRAACHSGAGDLLVVDGDGRLLGVVRRSTLLGSLAALVQNG